MAETSQDLDAARRFYTRISTVCDALADHDEHRARAAGIALLDPRPGERILEIGFGTGSSIVPIAANLPTPVDLHVAAVPSLPFGWQSGACRLRVS